MIIMFHGSYSLINSLNIDLNFDCLWNKNIIQ